jgi:hypothetical protein
MTDSLLLWLAFGSIGLLVVIALFALLFLAGVGVGKK